MEKIVFIGEKEENVGVFLTSRVFILRSLKAL